MQTIYVIVTDVHFLIQPYKSRVLHIMDMLLINFCIVHMQSMSVTSLTSMILVHALVVGPLLSIIIMIIH